MKNAKNARDDFWLDLGPAADWADMDAEDTARTQGDASPDGELHGYSGAEQGTVYQPGPAHDDPDCGCGCGKEKGKGCGCGHGGDHNQVPDVNGDTVPPEIPPIPPETWPGL